MPHHVLAPMIYQLPSAVVPAFVHLASRLSDRLDALPRGDALLQIVQPNVGIGLVMMGRIVAVNRWYANQLGYLPEEMVGHEVSEFVAGPYDCAEPGFTTRIVPVRHKCGHILRIRCTVYPLITDQCDRLVVFERLEV